MNNIDAYIEAKKNSWEETTKKATKASLQANEDLLQLGSEDAWEKLKNRTTSAYAAVTIWGRLVSYMDWLISTGRCVQGSNVFRVFRESNRLQFKHVYQRKQPDISFEEAKRRIQALDDAEVKRKAFELLGSGMRWNESFTYSDGKVVGKGRKVRAVFKPGVERSPYRNSYHTFWRALRAIGLKPHDLRKLAATKLYKEGVSLVDLCTYFGWSNPKTAMCYIAPTQNEELVYRVKKLLA